MPPLSLFSPRYWLLWIGIGLLWSLVQLPHHWRLTAGRFLGYIGYQLALRRRRIAYINLKLCFPELNAEKIHNLVRQHFASLGMSLLEMLSAWWLSDKVLQTLGHIEGLEHLHTGLARGKGVILLSAHFTSLEIGARLLATYVSVCGTYRPHENPLVEYFMRKNREKHAEKAIPRDAVRDMLRSLKQNRLLWFATDQNFGHKGSVFANFFGVPAATNTAAARLAEISGAAVVPFFTQRLADGQYKVTLHPILENFPGQDALQNAQVINQLIEKQILCAPEQYLWVHRRFKDRPIGMQNVYE